LPHQIIDEEIKRSVSAEADRFHDSFESIAAAQDFTLFQVTAFPQVDDEILTKRTKIDEALEKLNQE
jgi:hypothetical protein